MTFTYNFFHKAEDSTPIDTAVFEGASEQDVREAVHDYCDTYGYEAYTLAPASTPSKEKRVWTEEEIKTLVQTNDKVLYGALKNLYAQQTKDEQDMAETREANGMGFNGVDANFLTSVAQFLARTGFLTDKQKVVTRKKLVKYTKQLTRLANA